MVTSLKGVSERNDRVKSLVALLLIFLSLPSSAGELQDSFRNSGDTDIVVGDYRGMPTDHGITEMGIERTVCFGTCPAYTFIAKSDGTVRYVGDAFVDHPGTRTGKISEWRFHSVANLIRGSDFMNLHRGYTARVTDNPTVYTMVVMNGERKIVLDYAHAGPDILWAVEQLIDNLIDDVEWDQ